MKNQLIQTKAIGWSGRFGSALAGLLVLGIAVDATFSLEGQLWEVPLHLRGQLVQVRFNPFDWHRLEVWWEGKLVGPARRCEKQLNSKTYTDRDYERPQ